MIAKYKLYEVRLVGWVTTVYAKDLNEALEIAQCEARENEKDDEFVAMYNLEKANLLVTG